MQKFLKLLSDLFFLLILYPPLSADTKDNKNSNLWRNFTESWQKFIEWYMTQKIETEIVLENSKRAENKLNRNQNMHRHFCNG